MNLTPFLLILGAGSELCLYVNSSMAIKRNLIEDLSEVDVINKHFSELFDLGKFVRTVQIGFAQTSELVSITNSMHRINKHYHKERSSNELARDLKDAEELEEFAKRQVDLKHPYLYNLALIRTWSILETFVDEVAMSRLRGSTLDAFPQLHALKMSISEFINVDGAERLEIILTRFKETQASTLKKGNGRFKIVLDAVAVNGAVDEWVSKMFLEMSEIRNSLVHRGGVVDKRLLESCPWLREVRGGEVGVKEGQFNKYWYTAIWYVVKIKLALCDANCEEPGGGSRSAWKELLEFYKEKIIRLGETGDLVTHQSPLLAGSSH